MTKLELVSNSIPWKMEGIHDIVEAFYGYCSARLTPAQREVLKDGEIEGIGRAGTHAEVNAMNAAESMGLTPIGVAASRGICGACASEISRRGYEVFGLLK